MKKSKQYRSPMGSHIAKVSGKLPAGVSNPFLVDDNNCIKIGQQQKSPLSSPLDRTFRK